MVARSRVHGSHQVFDTKPLWLGLVSGTGPHGPRTGVSGDETKREPGWSRNGAPFTPATSALLLLQQFATKPLVLFVEMRQWWVPVIL